MGEWTISDQREFEKQVEDLEYDDLVEEACHCKDKHKELKLMVKISDAIFDSLEFFSLDKLFGIVNLLNEKINDNVPYEGKILQEKACQIIRDIMGDDISQRIEESIRYDKEE